jgi:hypothetical protein
MRISPRNHNGSLIHPEPSLHHAARVVTIQSHEATPRDDREMKENHPQIRKITVVPYCRTATNRWRKLNILTPRLIDMRVPVTRVSQS